MDYIITFSDVMAAILTLGVGAMGFFLKHWFDGVEQHSRETQEKIEQGNETIQERIDKNNEKVKQIRTLNISNRKSMILKVILLQHLCSGKIFSGA